MIVLTQPPRMLDPTTMPFEPKKIEEPQKESHTKNDKGTTTDKAKQETKLRTNDVNNEWK